MTHEWERKILLRILLDNRELAKPEIWSLTTSDFGDLRNAVIFATMKVLYTQGEDIDLISVVERLHKADMLHEAGGAHYICSLTDSLPR